MAEPSLFIWYHADAGLEPELSRWLGTVRELLGYRGELYRRDTPDQTTFMEIYRHVDEQAAARIEALAGQQDWRTGLHSPRRCEAFVPVA